jgi:protein-L-isoaspartate O-methyltransferase
MRNRERVLQSLENVYRSAFVAAEEAGDAATMVRLDLEYQRDQLHLEVLLDIRELLMPEEPDQTTSLLEKAQKLRRLTKLRP